LSFLPVGRGQNFNIGQRFGRLRRIDKTMILCLAVFRHLDSSKTLLLQGRKLQGHIGMSVPVAKGIDSTPVNFFVGWLMSSDLSWSQDIAWHVKNIVFLSSPAMFLVLGFRWETRYIPRMDGPDKMAQGRHGSNFSTASDRVATGSSRILFSASASRAQRA